MSENVRPTQISLTQHTQTHWVETISLRATKTPEGTFPSLSSLF